MPKSVKDSTSSIPGPVQELQIGKVKSLVYKSKTDIGVRFYAVFVRLYRQDEEWKATDSFGRDELLVLAKLADQTHSWICDQTKEPQDT